MASSIKEAIAEAMNANKPNSRNRPPELQEASDEHKACFTCRHFDAGTCSLYDYHVKPNQVCASWTPLPE